MLKTVYRSSRRDKHNCQRSDSNLGRFTPQSDAPTTRLLRLAIPCVGVVWRRVTTWPVYAGGQRKKRSTPASSTSHRRRASPTTDSRPSSDRLTSALVSNTPRSPTPADRISVWIQRNFGLVPVRTANVGACWRPDVEAYPSRPGSLSATSLRTNGQIRTLPEGTVQLQSNPTRTIQYDARGSRTTSHTETGTPRLRVRRRLRS